MVDEVAWGVGWGDSPSSSTPEEEVEELTRAHRSISRPRIDGSSSASLDAARRRSSSRNRRSLSRVSVLSDRSASNRSMSRNSSCALAESFLSTASSSYSSSSVPFDRHYESALLTPPSPGPSRGRRPTKKSHVRSASRSASPSMVPSTPLDFSLPLPSLSDVIEGAAAEPSRGRKAFIREVLTPRPRPADTSYTREKEDNQLDVLDETSRWTLKKAPMLSGLSRRLNPLIGRGRGGATTPSVNILRAGSTPPANEEVTAQGNGNFLFAGSGSSLGPGRSRSVGYDGARR